MFLKLQPPVKPNMPESNKTQTLHVVVDLSPGFAREDPATPCVVAAVQDKALAKRIAMLAGPSAVVQEVEVGAIPAGFRTRARELLGIELSDTGV